MSLYDEKDYIMRIICKTINAFIQDFHIVLLDGKIFCNDTDIAISQILRVKAMAAIGDAVTEKQ